MRTSKMVRMLCLIAIMNIFRLNAAITEFTGEELETIITTHALDFDFILIDIRDDMEVASGIIASEYCKPYHFSWNMGDFDEHYNEIPKDLAIIVYCRSGSRARSAVSVLSNAGFETIGTLGGGINAYGGTLEDSTELKPSSDFPEPSYFGTLTNQAAKPLVYHAARISRKNPLLYTVTLAGKVVTAGKNSDLLPAVLITRYQVSSERSIAGLRTHRNYQ